jgi:hypothetical protein
MHHIISSVSHTAQEYFSTLSHNSHDFLEKDTEYRMCILISLQLLFEIFLILRGSQILSHIYKNPLVKYSRQSLMKP